MFMWFVLNPFSSNDKTQIMQRPSINPSTLDMPFSFHAIDAEAQKNILLQN